MSKVKVVSNKEPKFKKKQTLGMKILTILFIVISVFYVMPVIIVLVNSFKTKGGIAMNLFALPNSETFHGFQNYIKGMTFGNYPFWSRQSGVCLSQSSALRLSLFAHLWRLGISSVQILFSVR